MNQKQAASDTEAVIKLLEGRDIIQSISVLCNVVAVIIFQAVQQGGKALPLIGEATRIITNSVQINLDREKNADDTIRASEQVEGTGSKQSPKMELFKKNIN